jgi:hypothetical protein
LFVSGRRLARGQQHAENEYPREHRIQRRIQLPRFCERIADRVDVHVFMGLSQVLVVMMIDVVVVLVRVMIDFGGIRNVQLGERLRAIEAQMQVRARHPRDDEGEQEGGKDPAPGGVHAPQHSGVPTAGAIFGRPDVRKLGGDTTAVMPRHVMACEPGGAEPAQPR